jgi:hypothetical protein
MASFNVHVERVPQKSSTDSSAFHRFYAPDRPQVNYFSVCKMAKAPGVSSGFSTQRKRFVRSFVTAGAV